MVKKIISGGQTGADLAALDFAIEFKIPHGGWIPKGRRTESGPLPEKYQLTETLEGGYSERTRLNILSADGTLIGSHGPLTGGSELTKTLADRTGKQVIHIDFNLTAAFQASGRLTRWLSLNKIEVLNVAGPRASKDPLIYEAVFGLLRTAFFMDISEKSLSDANSHNRLPHGISSTKFHPDPIDSAVSFLLQRLSFREKSRVANIAENRMDVLIASLSKMIMKQFDLDEPNSIFLDDCRKSTANPNLTVDETLRMIVKRFWTSLQNKKNILKVVK
jgi:hypothetical protein